MAHHYEDQLPGGGRVPSRYSKPPFLEHETEVTQALPPIPDPLDRPRNWLEDRLLQALHDLTALNHEADLTSYLVQHPDLHDWYNAYVKERDKRKGLLRTQALAKLTAEEKEALGLGNT